MTYSAGKVGLSLWAIKSYYSEYADVANIVTVVRVLCRSYGGISL